MKKSRMKMIDKARKELYNLGKWEVSPSGRYEHGGRFSREALERSEDGAAWKRDNITCHHAQRINNNPTSIINSGV